MKEKTNHGIREEVRRIVNDTRLSKLVRTFKPSTDDLGMRERVVSYMRTNQDRLRAMDVAKLVATIRDELEGEPKGLHRQIMKSAEFAWSTIDHDPHRQVDLSRVKRGEMSFPGSIFPNYDNLSRARELDMFSFLARVTEAEAGFGARERQLVLSIYLDLFTTSRHGFIWDMAYPPATFLNFFMNEMLERPAAWKALGSDGREFLIRHLVYGLISFSSYGGSFKFGLTRAKESVDDYFRTNGRNVHLSMDSRGSMCLRVAGIDCETIFTPTSSDLAVMEHLTHC